MKEFKNIREKLDRLEKTYRSMTDGGKTASYIPELADVNPRLFSISATSVGGESFSSGDSDTLFSMQSISKVVSLAFALERFGAERVFKKVGMEPCAEPFNSIMKLEISSNIPLNPFINSGAITVASLIAEDLGGDAIDAVLEFASLCAGRRPENKLSVNEKIRESEASTADRNWALAYFMHSTGALTHTVKDSLDLYFSMCSIEANTVDLSFIGATIANGGLSASGVRVISLDTVYILIGLMSTCGLYNGSGEFAVRVGLPAKSGVCGGILCTVPGRMGISVFSPPLDERGNSVAGVKALGALSREMKLRGL
ncbi:MAG: glutaminase A [Synergistaceae bacterium]|nr:glutaminase A [Synergistaceae bacterium]